jgi:hypothetical protein
MLKLFCYMCLFLGTFQAQTSNKDKLNDICMSMKSYSRANFYELIPAVAKNFLGMPYVANTLEKIPERLVVDLGRFDCVTFVETTVAIALSLKEDACDMKNFKKHLQNLRYEKGEIQDYASRLHYFSAWVNQQVSVGLLEEKTKQLGGDLLQAHNINYMTKHHKKYKQLSENPDLVEKIRLMENNLITQGNYILDKTKVAKIYSKLKTGDLVVIQSNMDGLDVNHVGFVWKEDKKAYLLHASSASLQKKVVISEQMLQEYLLNNRNHGGVRIFSWAK